MGNNEEQKKCIRTAQAKSSPNQRSLSRDHLDFWRKRIIKPRYSTQDGQKRSSPNFAVQIQCHGRRQTITLATSDRELAARKAQKLYITVRAIGWENALAELLPAKNQKKSILTVGDFLAEIARTADAEAKTIWTYARAFRTILADAFEIEPSGRHASRSNGNRQWITRIDSIRLRDVTPERIQLWKRRYLSKAGDNPLRLRAAKTSVNSYLRRAKSLFSEKFLAHLDRTQLPTPSPFVGVSFEKKQNVRYRSGFDVFVLLEAAQKELASAAPEQFKVLLLSLTVGLRAHEIDLAEWDWFDFVNGTLTVQPTRYFQPKSEYSLGTIDLEPELVAIFRGLRARARSNFVVESSLQPRTSVRYDYYRCRPHFDSLYRWLRTHGITERKPLHTLRKEFGSQVCDRFGIYAASRALRHASVGVTAAHYVDKKSKITSGLGAALSEQIIDFHQPTTAISRS